VTSALWYLGRGSGVVTLLLLTLVVVLGIASRSGRTLLGLPRFAVAAIHRTVSLLAVALLVVHVATLLFDPFAQLRLADLVIPFRGAYRPVWLGLGTLAADLVAALVATSLLRHRLGARAWRAVHWLAYAAWPVALLHGLGTGTDATTGWLRNLTVVCFGAVAGAVAWRLSPIFVGRPSVAPPAPPTAPADLRVRITAGGAR
jgi:sulfoxide reductase heme-binding subunit YedZ